MSKLVNIEEIVSSILIYIITFFTLLQVVTRYLFHIPFPWVEELARYLMIYMVYIVSAVAILRKEHFNIDALDLLLSRNKMRYINTTYNLLMLIFLTFFFYTGTKFIMYQVNMNQVSPALRISMGWPMSALIVGSLLMIVSTIGVIINEMFVKKG